MILGKYVSMLNVETAVLLVINTKILQYYFWIVTDVDPKTSCATSGIFINCQIFG